MTDPPDTAITIVETSPTPVQTPVEASYLRPRNNSESRVGIERTYSNTSSSYSPSSISRPQTPEDSSSDDGAQFGAPLSRVSTAPAQSTSSGGTVLAPSAKEQRAQAKHYASVNKLARMGFISPAAEGRATVTPKSSSTNPSSKPRFGGLKGLVQSLKGKA